MKNILVIFTIILMFIAYAYFGFGGSVISQNQNSEQGAITTGNNALANPLQGVTDIISNDRR